MDEPARGYEGWDSHGNHVLRLEHEVASRGERALPHIMAMFASNNERLQQSAERVLAEIGRPTVEPLLALLDETPHDPAARRRAISILGEIGDWRESARVAAQAKAASDEATRGYAVSTRGGTAAQLLQQDMDAEELLLAELARHDLPPDLWERRMVTLAHALQDEDAEVRAAAVAVLGKARMHQFSQASHPLLQVLEAASDAHSSVRREVLDALGWWATDSECCEWFDRAQVLATLERGLEDPEEEVRGVAIHALRLVPGDKALRLLLGVLKHPCPEMRLSAIFALKERHDSRAVPELERLTHEDTAEVQREWFRGHISIQKIAEEAGDAAQSIKRHHEAQGPQVLAGLPHSQPSSHTLRATTLPGLPPE